MSHDNMTDFARCTSVHPHCHSWLPDASTRSRLDYSAAISCFALNSMYRIIVGNVQINRVPICHRIYITIGIFSDNRSSRFYMQNARKNRAFVIHNNFRSVFLSRNAKYINPLSAILEGNKQTFSKSNFALDKQLGLIFGFKIYWIS